MPGSAIGRCVMCAHRLVVAVRVRDDWRRPGCGEALGPLSIQPFHDFLHTLARSSYW